MASTNDPVNPQLSLYFEPQRRVFRVSELNTAIRAIFNKEFLSIWVAGEISQCRAATSGHWYFTLKDAQSQLKCVLFKGNARWVKFRPQDGMMVQARGSLDVYEQRGEYQLIVEQLEPQGTGALQLAFEQLKKTLAAEGLFDQSRKRALPKYPRRIAVITSPAGAVIRDILHVLARRFPGLHVRVFPSLVQGEGAAAQICRGLESISREGWADVVIVARGGGSLEDLWPFNEESVARAIAACALPVISAIGHETDFTIADFVADLRAPTPSVAAELVICTRESLFQQIDAGRERLARALRFRLLQYSRTLEQLSKERAAMHMRRAIVRRAQRTDELEFKLRESIQRVLNMKLRQVREQSDRLQTLELRVRFAQAHTRLNALESRFVQTARDRTAAARRRYEGLAAHLKQLSPLAVLARGYSIVETPQGRIIRETNDTAPGETIAIRINNGRLRATVTTTETN